MPEYDEDVKTSMKFVSGKANVSNGEVWLLRAQDSNPAIILSVENNLVAVGDTNGNRGHLSSRSIKLADKNDNMIDLGIHDGKCTLALINDTNGLNTLLDNTTVVMRQGSDQMISLNAVNGAIRVGGPLSEGILVLEDKNHKERIYLNGRVGYILLNDKNNKQAIRLSASDAGISIGGFQDGHIHLYDKSAIPMVESPMPGAHINPTISLDASDSGIQAGGSTREGFIQLNDKNNNEVIRFDASYAGIMAGGSTREGILVLTDKNLKTTISLDASYANIQAGGPMREGHIQLNDKNNNVVIRLDATDARIVVGGSTREGRLVLTDKNYQSRIELDAQGAYIVTGGAGVPGKIYVRDSKDSDQVIIDGERGDVILTNADCAEDFEISEVEQVDPGTVMTINNDGKLVQGRQPYDKRVAGVVSGAGDLKPGLVLGRKQGCKDRLPIALVGRVNCKVDAGYEPVEVGDLLTTSETPGYAMKASDSSRSFGAVIGKALRPIERGRELIPILISLQ